MKTSKLIIKWKNFEKIFDDYDVFQFSYDYEKFMSLGHKKYEFDDAKGETKQFLKAMAVVYKQGGKCLFLFKKNSADESRIADFQKNHPYISDAQKIKAFDLKDGTKREHYFLKNDRALLQLLLNSIQVPKKEKYTYNNINGKLYFRIYSSNPEFSEEKGFLSFIEFHISSEMNLEFPLRTFKKADYGAYILDEDENFRYAISEDDKAYQHYIRESKDSAHNTATFLDFSSIEAVQNTKIFAIAKLMSQIKTKFSEYFEIEFDDKPNETFNKKKLEAENSHYDLTGKYLSSCFNSKGLYIINLLKDSEQAKQLQNVLIQLFKQSPVNIEAKEADEIMDDSFNVVIGHNKEFYVKNKIEDQDPYKQIHEHKLLQYVTIEDFKPKNQEEDPYFLKIVNELEIDAEVLDGTLKHVWQAVKKDWTFVSYSIPKNEEDISFVRMKVTTKDKLIFSHFKYSDLLYHSDSLDDEAITIIEYVSEIQRVGKNNDYLEQGENNGLVHFGEYVEGLCYCDIDNIHTIIQTPFHTLPDYEAIVKDVMQTSDSQIIDLTSVKEVITQLMKNELSKDNYETLLEKLNKYGGSVDFKTLKESKLFEHYTKSPKDNWKRTIIDTVYEKRGILLNPEFRSARMDGRYQLSNITDIQYFEQKRAVYNKERNIEKEIPSLSYICGRHQQGMQTSLPVGCVIRDVVWQKSCDFEELIKTMAVDFIRNDFFYTVLPFPFKYLREYEKMINMGIEI